ncbi:hypothetical protein N8J89_26650 [Crossiella sp. CA-258035]|uniref:hypothetical protein n=1 Tax=Crossiella sp. CA-258035 TaxID=2981138 RepID=UPI0024BC9572|nr:hypothetical protein [Crossiella sp. CA-258035]WHT16702.1 hypothetical protein N8J89_26650 [Crossiella sp. CA-258035]
MSRGSWGGRLARVRRAWVWRDGGAGAAVGRIGGQPNPATLSAETDTPAARGPGWTAATYLRGLRLATVLITFAGLLGLALPVIIAHAEVYRSLTMELVAFGVLFAVAVFCAVRADPGRWRWPLLVLVFGSALLALTGVPPELVVSRAEWSFMLLGWFGILLLLDKGIGALLIFLGVHAAVNLGQLVLVGQANRAALVGLLIAGVTVFGYQVAVGFAAVMLHRIAAKAAVAARAEQQRRTATAIAAELQRDHQERYAALSRTALPLLVDLASGRADPGDELVRRRAAVEAARMRRLFAEGDEVADPLLHELAACIDTAQRQGVSVQLAVRGQRPPLDLAVRRALTEPALATLVAAASTARVTVVGSANAVTVSVVADAPEPPVVRADGVEVTNLVNADRVWVEAKWRAQN